MSTDTPTPEAVEPTEEEVKEAGKFFSLHIKHGELRSDSDAFIRDLAFAFMARRITARAQAAAQAAQRAAQIAKDFEVLDCPEWDAKYGFHKLLPDAIMESAALPLPTPTPHPLDSVLGAFGGEAWEEVFDELQKRKDAPPEDLHAQLQQAQQTAQIAKQIATEATEQSKAYRGMCEDFKRLADYWQQKAEATPPEDDREDFDAKSLREWYQAAQEAYKAIDDREALLRDIRKEVESVRTSLQLVGIKGDDSAWLEMAREELDALLARLPR
jgi:hypothetical protein